MLAPKTVMLAEPVAAVLLRASALMTPAALENNPEADATCQPALMCSRPEDARRSAARHIIEVSEAQLDASHDVGCILNRLVQICCPRPAPCTVKLRDPVLAAFRLANELRRGRSALTNSVELPET